MALTWIAAMYRSHTVCHCPERIEATHTHSLRWSHELGGWWWSDAPTRTSKWNQSHDNDGFPYIHTLCDFCGEQLPGVVFKDDSPTGQADGNSEGRE